MTEEPSLISHPEKLLFPDDGISKGELAAYYEAVAEFMLPHLAGRPLTMERFPAGIASPGFFQKNVIKGFPAWLPRVEVPKKSGSTHFPVINDLRSLLCLGAELVKRHPEQFTQEFSKADRGERILVDTGRNGYGATFAAPYAVRPKPGAPVSAPCTWEELEEGRVTPRTFTLRNMAARLSEVGDLWQNLAQRGQSLTVPSQRLMSLLSDTDWQAAFAAATRRPGSRHKKSK